MYYYFVSFSHSNGYDTAFGHCSIAREKPITQIEDINSIELKISHAHEPSFENVIILNYQLLRQEPNAEKTS